MAEKLLPVFSSSFVASGLTFRSFIQFECIFVYDKREWCSLILLHVAVQFPCTVYWRDCLFSIGYSFLLCWRLTDQVIEGSFLGFLFCSIDLCVYFCASTILSWSLQLCPRTWSQELWCLQLCFSFSRLLWLFGVFCGSIQILGLFVLVFWKMLLVFWYLTGIELNV